MADVSSAEYKGDAKLEEVILNRAEYVGKIVKIKVRIGKSSLTSGDSWIFVRDSQEDFSAPDQRLRLSGQQALEWAVKQAKRGGTSCTVYTLVDERELIALGVRQSQADNGYTYSW